VNVEVQPAAVEIGSDRGPRPPHRPGRRRILVAMMVIGCLAVVALIAAAGFLAALPGVGDAPGRVAAILREHGGRPGDSPPPSKVASSIVAVEDQRFYAHHGVDLQSVIRVAWGWVISRGSRDQGGSTITQQLAKRLYSGHRAGLLVELEQVGLALKLEQRYSKPEILRMYLDAVYFGDGRWGVVQASEGYFGKPPQRLDWGEASLLAGLVQAPSAYDPRVHLAAAVRRQRHVLDRLVATRVLGPVEAAAASRRFAVEAGRLGFVTSSSPTATRTRVSVR
jgi:penicillin-binding protein 1A